MRWRILHKFFILDEFLLFYLQCEGQQADNPEQKVKVLASAVRFSVFIFYVSYVCSIACRLWCDCCFYFLVLFYYYIFRDVKLGYEIILSGVHILELPKLVKVYCDRQIITSISCVPMYMFIVAKLLIAFSQSFASSLYLVSYLVIY